jgi:hypothetical protein
VDIDVAAVARSWDAASLMAVDAIVAYRVLQIHDQHLPINLAVAMTAGVHVVASTTGQTVFMDMIVVMEQNSRDRIVRGDENPISRGRLKGRIDHRPLRHQFELLEVLVHVIQEHLVVLFA